MTKTKTIEECLQNLSQEEINNIYERIPKEIKPKKKKVTEQDKIDLIIAEITAGYMVHCLMFTEEEEKQLADLINGKNPKDISYRLLENNFVFKIDDNYIVPEEIIDMINYTKKQKMNDKRKEMIVDFYLSSNGVLEITKLIELLKSTGMTITKEELTQLAKERDYIIDDNLIYFDEVAQGLDKELNIHDQKKENTYKEFTIEEIFAIQLKLGIENHEEHIKKILSKKVKNKKQATMYAHVIFNTAKIGYNYIENIENYIKDKNISLTENEQELLFDIVNRIYNYFPVWELNGNSNLELSADINLMDYRPKFVDLTEEEQPEAYINAYLTINAIIEIDKLLEILNTNHNLNITKKDLIKTVSNSDDLIIYKKYICINGTEQLIDKMVPLKNMLDQYKIIDDVDEIMDRLYEAKDRIIELCYDYDLDEDIAEELGVVMQIGGIIPEEMLEALIKESDYKLSPKKIKELHKELSKIEKDIRVWSYNGFKKSELTNLNKKEKIGRNDLCPCGSGKKYKKCCGKN